jgi:hypothetical protein
MRTAAPVVLALVVLASLTMDGCKRPSERRKEQARLDSLKNDTARPAYNPYKFGQGNTQYNRERENLGNLDSLVAPASPTPSTTPRNPKP